MSSAGTTLPGRTWVSSKPPTFVTQLGFGQTEDDRIELSPDIVQPRASIKYDPNRPGGSIFTDRTLNTFKKKKQTPGILKKSDVDAGKSNVRFLDDETNTNKEVVTTKVGDLTIRTAKSYEAVIAERDALLENDGAYKRRIKQLEEENARVLIDYDGVYKENKILRDKLDKGDDTHIESYQRVYDDRQILREAESAYKRRIKQLEDDAKGMLKNFESLYSENKVLRDKGKKLNDRLNAIDRLDDVKKINELEKKVKLLEKTVRTMGYEREAMVKENHEIENQMYKLREDIADLNRRNLLLEKENEGFKRGFMALGKDADNSWRDELRQKTRRQEEEERILREEHAKFRKEIESMTKAMHNLEKVNVELNTRNNIIEQDKKDFEKRLFELTNEQRNRTPSAVKRRDAELAQIKEHKLDEMQQKVEELKAENASLKAKNDIMEKEKATFDQKLEEASKQKRETASSIRRKMETEREVRDLNMHVDTFKEKTKRLEVENADLKEELNKLQIESKAQRQASNALASDKANQIDAQVKDLNTKIITQNEALITLTEENLKLKTEYNSLKERLQDQLDAVKKDKENLEREKESIQTNMEHSSNTTSGKIQELQDELNALHVELKILKPKHDDLQKQYDDQKDDNKGLANQLDDKQKELDQLKDSLRNNRDVYNELSKAQRENATLKREIDELNDKHQTDLLKQEADLEELLKNQEFMNTALAEHKVRLDMLQEEKNELKSENVKLVKANERQAKSIADHEVDAKKMLGDNSTKLKELQDELQSTKKELKQSDKELVQAKQEIEIAKNERENQVNKLMKQMDKLKAEREHETQQLKEQSESLRSEVARLKIFEERIEGMETNLQELVSKLNETEERNKKLTNAKLASLQLVVGEMKSENLANRIRAAEREQNELEKHRLELEIKQDAINEIRKLKEENHRLMGLLEDKRLAEEEQDEWTKKRNKFNEVMAQNKRMQEENKRLLSMVENNPTEYMKKDLQNKSEKLKVMEAKFQEYTVENANLKKNIEQKEADMRRLEATAERSTRVQQENNKLVAENKRLRDEGMQKDSVISSLKELEVTKAKYMDSATHNQRLYEENMRLRETIEKSKDYKSEFNKIKSQEKNTLSQQAKYQEENALLKNTLQIKEMQLRREVELQKERVTNLEARNKRLVDEMAKLKLELSKKDDVIIKLKDLEGASGKLKDANLNASRLYEENQRLRNLLETGGGWRGNFQNAKALSGDAYNRAAKPAAAVYVEPSNQGKPSEKLLKERKERTIPENTEASFSSQPSDEGRAGSKLKIKPLLPEINQESSGLVYGLSYQELHSKAKGLKGAKLIEALNKDINALKADIGKRDKEIRKLKDEAEKYKPGLHQLAEEKETLNSEVARLRKELNVKSIGESLSKTTKLQEQNRRLTSENQRLRDELNARDLQLANFGVPGYNVAQFVEKKTAKSPEERLNLAMAENKRLSDEVHRLRAALDESHGEDTSSRFRQQSVTGSMIDGFKDAKARTTKWATSRPRKGREPANANETDDKKLMLIEEMGTS